MATQVSAQDLITAPTQAQICQTLLTAMAATGLPVTAWGIGNVLRAMANVVAGLIAAGALTQAQINAAAFLDTATGIWLRLLAVSVYSVSPPAATYAAGPLTLVNAAGGVFSWAVGQCVIRNTANGCTYRNTAAVSLGASATVTAPFQCDAAGSIGSANPAAISTPVSAMVGVTVSNAAAFVGVDAISDANLRQLCRNKLGALSPNGPKSAYLYAAQQAVRSDGSNVGVNRVRAQPAIGNSTVTVAVAQPSGAPSSGDLAYVDASIKAICVQDTVAETTIAATVYTGSALAIAGTIAVDSSINLTNTQIENFSTAALNAFLSGIPLGGYTINSVANQLPIRMIETAAGSWSPLVLDVDISIPASDLTLAWSDVVEAAAPTWTVFSVNTGPT